MRQTYKQRVLNPDGFPRTPERQFLHIQRRLVTLISFEHALLCDLELHFPVRFLGQTRTLVVGVERVTIFPSGTLVELVTMTNDIFNSTSWPSLLLWIPPHGSCGILT
jgi:hypothetical protein